MLNQMQLILKELEKELQQLHPELLKQKKILLGTSNKKAGFKPAFFI